MATHRPAARPAGRSRCCFPTSPHRSRRTSFRARRLSRKMTGAWQEALCRLYQGRRQPIMLAHTRTRPATRTPTRPRRLRTRPPIHASQDRTSTQTWTRTCTGTVTGTASLRGPGRSSRRRARPAHTRRGPRPRHPRTKRRQWRRTGRRTRTDVQTRTRTRTCTTSLCGPRRSSRRRARPARTHMGMHRAPRTLRLRTVLRRSRRRTYSRTRTNVRARTRTRTRTRTISLCGPRHSSRRRACPAHSHTHTRQARPPRLPATHTHTRRSPRTRHFRTVPRWWRRRRRSRGISLHHERTPTCPGRLTPRCTRQSCRAHSSTRRAPAAGARSVYVALRVHNAGRGG
jgi:hypothetical protein